MSPNRSTYREAVRLPSRPMSDRAGSQYSGSMAYNGKHNRPRRKRKIGRRILALIILLVIAWFGREEIIGTVQGWLNIDSVDEMTADLTNETTDPARDSGLVSSDSLRESDEAVGTDSVAQAGLMNRVGGWLEDKLADVFVVKRIVLEGNRSLSEDLLLDELADVQGSPMLGVDPPALADSLRQHPRVRDVVVGRQFPSTITVDVEECREVAVLISNGGVWSIDESRVVLPLPGTAWPLDLPVITGLMSDPESGSTLSDSGIVKALDWVLAAAELPRVQAWLSELHLSGGELSWIAGDDGRIALPGAHSVIAQVATIDAYLASDKTEDGRFIDLSFPDYLVVRREPWKPSEDGE